METIILDGETLQVSNSTVVLLKLVHGETLTDEELIYTDEISREHLLELARTGKANVLEILYDVCDSKHASCVGCPVQELMTAEERKDECKCFRSGRSMRTFLKSKVPNNLR